MHRARRTPSLLLLALAPLVALAVARAADGPPPAGEESGEAAYFRLEEQVVSLATKKPVTALEAPAIVSVITAQDIREHGYRSVAEALRWVPGFYALDDQVFSNFGVRGVNAGDRGASRILKVMIDGQPTAFRPTTGNFLGPELIPMSAVQKVEVVRGPGSALYGANAFLGVVNVVTKKGADVDGLRVTGVGEETEHTGRLGGGGEVVAGGVFGKLDVMGAGSYFRLDRSGIMLPSTAPITVAQRDANRIVSDDDFAEPASFYSRMTYDTDVLGKVTLHGSFERLNSVSEFQDLGTLPFLGTPPDTRPVVSKQVLDNGFVRLIDEAKPLPDLETVLSFAYAAGGPDDGDRFDTGQASTFFLRRYGYQSFDLAASAGYQIAHAVHVTLGLDHTMDYHSLLTYDAVIRADGSKIELQPGATKTFNNTGVYAQGILTPIDPVTVTLGVRLDENSIYGDQVNGRAGIVYHFLDDGKGHGWSMKLLFGSSFQAPSPELLFGQLAQPFDIIGNPDLKPQRAYSWEASLGYHGEVVGANVNTFFNRIKDLAEFEVVGGNLRAENAVDLDSYGFEGEAFARYGDLALRASVSYQRTLRATRPVVSTQNTFPTREGDLFPRWVVSFGPSYKIPMAPLVVSWDNQWVDSRPASVGNVAFNEAPYELSAYLLSTITLSTTDVKLGALDAFGSFQVADLFDERPSDPGFDGVDFPSRGRRYVLTVGVKF